MHQLRNLAVVCALLVGVGVSSAQEPPLELVATFSILGDWVENVAGDAANLTVLVGPDSDSHVYEPTPRDSVALSNADLVFENGLAFETWLDDLYAASGSQATRVVVTEGFEPIAVGEEREYGDEGEHEHEHGEFDPHVWHDVAGAVRAVETIRGALVEADPENAATYRANAEVYLEELDALDAFIREEVAQLPETRRKLVTSHDTFGYFARAYDFEVVGAVLPSISTEASDPAAGELAALVDTVRAAEVPAIFTENISNPRLAERAAQEAGVALAPPLYTDALGVPGSAGETYLQMVRHNVTTIVAALSAGVPSE